jgi:O-methyltransferase
VRPRLPRPLRRRGDGSAEQPADPTVSEADRAIVERARASSIAGPARLQAVVDAVRHCERRGIPGDLVECGVWRGGSVLAMVLVLQEIGAERDIHLYDTFEGMTEPTAEDVSLHGQSATELWEETGGRPWRELFDPESFSEDSVRELLLGTGYPAERLHLVRGPVEETLPQSAPDRIALLRLDTDWYESTRHELHHLYPRLTDGGVLIVDDYGHWDGVRRAVDEYFATEAEPLLLARTDYTGRMAVKR